MRGPPGGRASTTTTRDRNDDARQAGTWKQFRKEEAARNLIAGAYKFERVPARVAYQI